MKLYLLEFDAITVYLFYLAGACIGWAIFYYTIKAAVKNGILETQPPPEKFTSSQSSTPETTGNKAQIELQSKYDKGLISFDHYKKEWETLK